jgi:hypothetical protein
MNFLVTNEYKVEFKDGSAPLENNGESSSTEKSSITDELSWIKFHIEKELLIGNKTLADVKSVSIKLSYTDLNS